MIKYSNICIQCSNMQLKTTRLRTILYTNNESSFWTNLNKINGRTFRGGAHTKQGFRT